MPTPPPSLSPAPNNMPTGPEHVSCNRATTGLATEPPRGLSGPSSALQVIHSKTLCRICPPYQIHRKTCLPRPLPSPPTLPSYGDLIELEVLQTWEQPRVPRLGYLAKNLSHRCLTSPQHPHHSPIPQELHGPAGSAEVADHSRTPANPCACYGSNTTTSTGDSTYALMASEVASPIQLQ